MQISGSPFDFVIAFFAGFLASLTPCVYPLIPIGAGYVVGSAQSSKVKALLLSLSYVTGMALVYSFLGILAVLTGSIFGSISSAPAVGLVSGAFILVFGLFMFDLFHFSPRTRIRMPVYGKNNFLGALLLGAVSGLMITPCLSPVLGAILSYLATKNNVFYGCFLLLSFSFGMGLIFILVGTFGAGIAGLPKSGRWMLVIKKICAAIMVGAGIYFIFSSLRRF
ncbi:MAG: cytochrome c biogenesis protein CcdA [Candidatus Omnitrophica bacterium]|jgi:thiol:disulfide interchange protein DsbD|nr:sulfite exporter TauE/SafE family protein [Candidatus Omnitrophota bacterium]MDD3274689.1 cytochrome c biogenesis protein CcdA [Candidatus Omnitrophota bacterium]MDD5077691.1 cytochrome c biogenesis protein CcdA [Candidatus Omnitrophota bacterium]MDD5724747.1 cytochrome c biogenesis protein CcdA [Candidatus Omnitrophota bacterium]